VSYGQDKDKHVPAWTNEKAKSCLSLFGSHHPTFDLSKTSKTSEHGKYLNPKSIHLRWILELYSQQVKTVMALLGVYYGKSFFTDDAARGCG
jgi:hypothetical protein